MAVLARYFRIVAPDGMRLSVERFLRAEGYEFSQEAFSDCCYKLLEEPRPLGSSLAAFFGYIYIQDRSSMLPPLALSPKPGSAVLDMCASPGSKTGFLASLVGREGMVLANEPNGSRLATLRANLDALDLCNVASCQYDGAALPLFPESWNAILLDPPCSGWGTENKNPAVRKLWHGAKTERLVRIQRTLLGKAASLLAPGGRLLYSTCTTNVEENERQAEFALSELALELESLRPVTGFNFSPSELPGTLLVDGPASGAQGFFLALLRKPGSAETTVREHDFFTLPEDSNLLKSIEAFLKISALPAGSVGTYGAKVRFLPALAGKFLPANLRWQGRSLGEFARNGRFLPNPRLKSLFSPFMPVEQINDIHVLRAFLSGQARAFAGSAETAALYWEDLPLGRCRISKGRLISPFSLPNG